MVFEWGNIKYRIQNSQEFCFLISHNKFSWSKNGSIVLYWWNYRKSHKESWGLLLGDKFWGKCVKIFILNVRGCGDNGGGKVTLVEGCVHFMAKTN